MGVLNSWQRIDRVVPGQPFGTGSSGNVTLSSDPNTRATAIGTAGFTALTIGSAILSNGDVFAIHQSQLGSYGQWEINRVASGGTTTSIVCVRALQYTYVAGAQIVKIPMYNTVGVNSFTPSAWNGSYDGLPIIVARTSVTINGSQILSIKGSDGSVGSKPAGGVGVGFRGGQGQDQNPAFDGFTGEGYPGGSGRSRSANGNGGGAGELQGAPGGADGGGGGNGTMGISGEVSGIDYGGFGGGVSGTDDLTNFTFGGGGGGGAKESVNTTGSGGAGGGGLIIFTSNLIVTGSITGNGGNGASSVASGGGGAGGSILIVVQKATLGSNLVTAIGGSPAGAGGGGNGRIAVHHSGLVTGSTNPAFTDITDLTIRPAGGIGMVEG